MRARTIFGTADAKIILRYGKRVPLTSVSSANHSVQLLGEQPPRRS